MTSFLAFAKLCQEVEAVSGSLEKVDLVAAFLAGFRTRLNRRGLQLCHGHALPAKTSIWICVGPSILYEALAKAGGCPAEQISQMLRTTGDPGLVAAGIAVKKRPIPASLPS